MGPTTKADVSVGIDRADNSVKIHLDSAGVTLTMSQGVALEFARDVIRMVVILEGDAKSEDRRG